MLTLLPTVFTPSEDQMRAIAEHCRCPQSGDEARLGDVLASGIEPGYPAARIVAFVNRREDGTPAKGMYSLLVRLYREGDSWFPTGELRYGALGMAWGPWTYAHEYKGAS